MSTLAIGAQGLQLNKLCAYYGRAQILFEVSLAVAPGEVVALMGRNGAGKSTTLKAIMNMLGPLGKTTGEIKWRDESILGWPSYKIARAGLGFVPEDRRIFTELTVLENLAVGTRHVAGVQTPWSIDRLHKLFPNLASMSQRLGSQMSGGEQQMLTVARTLMGNPRLILLDEPSEGVAPLIVEQMADAVIALKKQGLSVLLSEQNFPFAREVSDKVVVLEKGQVRFTGAMAELDADESVRRQYLSI
jgi:branched-chain amino acid transport system ATP-binding protein